MVQVNDQNQGGKLVFDKTVDKESSSEVLIAADNRGTGSIKWTARTASGKPSCRKYTADKIGPNFSYWLRPFRWGLPVSCSQSRVRRSVEIAHVEPSGPASILCGRSNFVDVPIVLQWVK